MTTRQETHAQQFTYYVPKAIRCLRSDLSEDCERDEREMTRIGVQLGYAVDEALVVIAPSREGPFTTIWLRYPGVPVPGHPVGASTSQRSPTAPRQTPPH